MNEVKELVEFDKIASGMAEIQNKGNFLPDMDTKEGYEASKRFVLDVTTPTRTSLDKAHKTAKAYWIAGGKGIDTKKNELMSLLVEIQRPHQEAYKAFDQAEKDKKAKFEADIQDKIDFFHGFMMVRDGSSVQITATIDHCGETDTAEGFYHRGADAVKAKNEAMQHLNELLMTTISREAEEQRQVELAEENRLRQAEIDKQQEAMRLQQEEINKQQARIEREANEAAEKAQAEVNEKQRLIHEYDRAEKEKQAAIEREQYAKEQSEIAAKQAKEAEAQRQYEERIKEEAEAAKREANVIYKSSVKKSILDVLLANNIPEGHARTMVKLAANKALPKLTINY